MPDVNRRVKPPAQEWLMLAFPGEDTGKYALRTFAPSKSGKCWYRRLPTREAALQCKRELVEAGIGFKCVKFMNGVQVSPPSTTAKRYRPGQRNGRYANA